MRSDALSKYCITLVFGVSIMTIGCGDDGRHQGSGFGVQYVGSRIVSGGLATGSSTGTFGSEAQNGECLDNSVEPIDADACAFKLLEPKPCEVIDLTKQPKVVFRWSFNPEACGAPFALVVAGDPYSDDNAIGYTICQTDEPTVVASGVAAVPRNVAQLQSLRSDTGVLHWYVIAGNSRSGAQRLTIHQQ